MTSKSRNSEFPFHRLINCFDAPNNPSWRDDNPEEEEVISLRSYQKQPRLVRPTPRRRSIFVQPIGTFDGESDIAIKVAQEGLEAFFSIAITVLPPLSESEIPDQHWRGSPLPGETWSQADGSYLLNDLLLPRVPRNAVIVKALTSFDLWDGDYMNYVLGWAI